MSNVDLSALRIDESQAAVPRPPLGPRLLVAGVVLLTLAVAVTFLWPILMPPRSVRMAAVHAADSGSAAVSTTATTEAVGWVEADPFPHIVRPLVTGRVDHCREDILHLGGLTGLACQRAHHRHLAHGNSLARSGASSVGGS